MKTIPVAGVVLIALQVAVFAAGKGSERPYVVPLGNSVPVYGERIRRGNETPMFRVNGKDRLAVLGESGVRYKISNGDGKTGWVDKKRVGHVKSGKRFVFNNTEVHGYLDDPSPVYIIDADGPENITLNLERSFHDALRENVDKYTVRREAETGNRAREYRFQ